MLAFLSPYTAALKIGAALALLLLIAAGVLAYNEHERGIGRATVQAAWDQANKVAFEARGKRIAEARKEEAALQAAADDRRRSEDVENKRMDARLVDNLAGLRDRPERPVVADKSDLHQPVAGPPTEGGGATGAGLYRDDAAFLTRFADLTQRVRNQLDSCYQQYGEAQRRLKAQGAGP